MYNPSKVLKDGFRNMFPLELCPWDDYFPRMAQSDFYLGNHNKRSSKTFFIRKAPFGGSFAIMGGITAFLRILEDYRFDEPQVMRAMDDQGYRPEFLKYLSEELKTLQISVIGIQDGMVFYPNEPAVTVEGDLVSVRLAEGILTKCVNFPTLSMTKWHRVVDSAAPGLTYEFSRRRAQNDILTTIYAHLAGVNISSNSEARRGFDIPIKGSMGHEWVQGFGDEYKAFDSWLEINPDRPILLVDTISTLNSGLPNAIKAFNKHWSRIKEAGGIPGIRNDSGDLAYLTIEERIMLDKAGLEEVLIFQTNDLEEYAIQAIREQIFTQAPKAGLDPFSVIQRVVWACGTNPGTCSDQPSIGGVMKLTSIDNNRGELKAVIKIAHDNPIKTSIPGSNRSVHVYTEDGNLLCCLIYHKDENPEEIDAAYHPDDKRKCIILAHYKNLRFEKRQVPLHNPRNSELTEETIDSVRERVAGEVKRLHWTHKRLESPHKVKVSLSEKVFDLREYLIMQNKLIED